MGCLLSPFAVAEASYAILFISDYPLLMLLSVVGVVADLLSWWCRGARAGDVQCNEAAAARLTFVIRHSASAITPHSR